MAIEITVKSMEELKLSEKRMTRRKKDQSWSVLCLGMCGTAAGGECGQEGTAAWTPGRAPQREVWSAAGRRARRPSDGQVGQQREQMQPHASSGVMGVEIASEACYQYPVRVTLYSNNDNIISYLDNFLKTKLLFKI